MTMFQKTGSSNTIRRTGSLAMGFGLVLGVAACGNSGADYQPIVDGTPNARYADDLAACQQVAEQRSYLNDNVQSESALWAGIGGATGAVADGVEGAIAGAVIGGLVGAAEPSWDTMKERQQIVTDCMKGRGHPVVG